VQGSARGKLLGFPTANIMTVNEITPQGVFITEARLDRKTFPSVTNIGSRPTFGAEPFQVETFIFNFDRTVYGKKIRLCFLQKIRNERKFSTPQALVRQVRKDIKAARGYFERQGYSLEG
ncbi:MAG: bifunctional riboflavin kinase/FMN adenylyltransferase, partial [Candidatus Aminicenantes bacterium]|nr:bifunctional riboflavin kinase/FMN adenylyltransferase [Candidatus Aminicenantes bacterium]